MMDQGRDRDGDGQLGLCELEASGASTRDYDGNLDKLEMIQSGPSMRQEKKDETRLMVLCSRITCEAEQPVPLTRYA